MLTVTTSSWYSSNILSRNIGSPSISNDFSFITYGNAIKE